MRSAVILQNSKLAASEKGCTCLL